MISAYKLALISARFIHTALIKLTNVVFCFSFWLTGQIVGHFKGFAGAIRCISCLSKQKIVASCGLDKFLRIHDIHSRRMVHKVYVSLPPKGFSQCVVSFTAVIRVVT